MDNKPRASEKDAVVTMFTIGALFGIGAFGLGMINGLPLLECVGWFLFVTVIGIFAVGSISRDA